MENKEKKSIDNYRLKPGFGMVSTTVMKDPNISLRDKGLYAYLSIYADACENNLHVGINKMATDCGVTTSTVKRILEDLISKNVIIRVRRGKKVSSQTTLLK